MKKVGSMSYKQMQGEAKSYDMNIKRNSKKDVLRQELQKKMIEEELTKQMKKAQQGVIDPEDDASYENNPNPKL